MKSTTDRNENATGTGAEYIKIQGFNVRRDLIETVLGEMGDGAEVVPDSDILHLAACYVALKTYRDTYGREPQAVSIREDPFHWYVFAIPNVHVMGLSVPVTHKVLWFRKPKRFKLN